MNIVNLEIEPNSCPLTDPLAIKGFLTHDPVVCVNVGVSLILDIAVVCVPSY
jgi:hypothetical protein